MRIHRYSVHLDCECAHFRSGGAGRQRDYHEQHAHTTSVCAQLLFTPISQQRAVRSKPGKRVPRVSKLVISIVFYNNARVCSVILVYTRARSTDASAYASSTRAIKFVIGVCVCLCLHCLRGLCCVFHIGE